MQIEEQKPSEKNGKSLGALSNKEEKQKPLKNQAKTAEAQIVFKKASWISFVDARASNDERFDKFCVGQLSDTDMMKGESKINVHIYNENDNSDLEFS